MAPGWRPRPASRCFETLLGLASPASPSASPPASAVSTSSLAARLLSPFLVVSQALPVFALAPLLVLWFGFGLASKVVMTTLVISFPVASAFADGLARTETGISSTSPASPAPRRLRTLRLIRVPARRLPALVTGIRVAAVYAPIGAVIGEWVGASRGLGLLMVQANARMQTALLFAALGVLAAATLGSSRSPSTGLTPAPHPLDRKPPVPDPQPTRIP